MRKSVFSFIVAFIAFVYANDSFSQKLFKSFEKAHTGQILSVAINNDGSQIITGGADKRAILWDVNAGTKKPFNCTGEIKEVAFNSSGKLFLTTSKNMSMSFVIWGSEDFKPKQLLKGYTSPIVSAAFNPVSEQKAGGSEDGKIFLWNDEKGNVTTTLEAHSKQVNALAFSPDGKFLASGSDDNTIVVWDPAFGQKLNTIECSKNVTSLSFSSDGKYIACGSVDGTVKLWNPQTGNKLAEFIDYAVAVNAVAFSPDVQYVAAAGAGKNIIIWDVETQQIVKNFPAHDADINAIAFSDKGNYLVSVGSDGNVKIWDVLNLNIGKKKFIKEGALPALVCSPVILKEDNNNGIIESGEKPTLNFTITNQGEGQAYDVIVQVALKTPTKGIVFDKEFILGNLRNNKSQKVEIPITTNEELTTASSAFTVNIVEANGNNAAAPADVNFQTKGANNVFVMAVDYKYTSATGKAEKKAPIDFTLSLQNSSSDDAHDIKIKYKFPEHVIADKLVENIDVFKSLEVKQVTVQFYADETYGLDSIPIEVEVQGALYTDFSKADLTLSMNKELPVSAGLYAEEQPLYRGGGVDPLKGTNFAKAKQQMEIGAYYALIIGIDKYTGEWTQLKNAVNDAKAIEALLKQKYKIDHFKVLYNEQATRQAIIAAMEWLVDNVKEKDNVFIFYSGHGEYKQSLNKGYWVPVDATTASTSQYISNSDLQTYLGGIKSKHTLLVSDACFSGDIFRGNTVSVPFENTDKYYSKVHDLISRQAITSGGIEPVMDGGREGHSVFAYYFLKTLQNNDSKYLDAGQLYNKIKIPVVNNSSQDPKMAPISNTGDEGGQFIFVTK